MTKKVFFILLALVLAISISLIGCTSTGQQEEEEEEEEPEPIIIGLFFDYSGMGSVDIPYHEVGVRLKLDEIGWEIEGRSIELVTADNAGDPAKGVESIERLVQVDEVDVIIGPVWGHVQLAIAPILAESKTPIICPSGGIIDVIETCPDNFFLTRGTFAGNAYYSGVYAYEEMEARTAVILYNDFATGESFLSGFVTPFEEMGGVIVQTIKPPLGTFDYAPFLTDVEDADVLAMWIQPPELPSFYAQYYASGLDIPIIYTSITAQSESWSEVGDLCIGTIGQHEYSPLLDNDENEEFLEKVDDMTFIDFQAAGYTAVSIFLEAVKSTNGDTTPEVINPAIRNVSVDTPEGRISYTSENVGIGDTHIMEIVKVGDRYEEEILKTYEQVVRKAPWE